VSGNVVGVIGVGQDITERKQAEQEKSRVARGRVSNSRHRECHHGSRHDVSELFKKAWQTLGKKKVSKEVWQTLKKKKTGSWQVRGKKKYTYILTFVYGGTYK